MVYKDCNKKLLPKSILDLNKKFENKNNNFCFQIDSIKFAGKLFQKI